MRSVISIATTLALSGAVLVAAGPPSVSAPAGSETARVPSAAQGVPALSVRRMVQGLTLPWDVARLPNRSVLITERESGRILMFNPRNRTLRQVGRPSGFWATGETGLMSIVRDPAFRSNSRFYTCSGYTNGSKTDIRVVAWRMNAARTGAREVDVLLGGLPIYGSGRHGGCRLIIAEDGSMFVGTGDAVVGTNPQNKRSLGGKVLRLNRMTGRPWSTNPWIGSRYRNTRYLWTYGHRNVQGLAQRRDGTVWAVEHGPDVDDEVNLLRRGGNYGWNPVPGYNESVPMTDHSLPGRQVSARWRSGSPTLATSGAAWVRGRQWGALNGTLAVAALKANRVVFMKFDADGTLRWTRTPPALRNFGRLRSVRSIANGDLLVTTSNGGGDSVLRVRPRG